MPRSSRLALWCLALLLSISLLVKGRVPTEVGEGAAFFITARPGSVTVRLAGDVPKPGLYRFPDGTSPESAIKMTLPGMQFTEAAAGAAGGSLKSGDTLTLKRQGRQPAVLSKGRMAARECMLLSIPLHPDQLGPEEWAYLPGIGPALAARIVADRHKNGAFVTLDGVMRVPGIGPGKLAAIKRYF
jgi:competence protein ComEA